MNSFKINKIEYIIDKTWESNYFVGIRIVDNKYHVSFPIGYNLKENMSEDYYRKVLIDLYKTTNLAKVDSIKYGNDNYVSDIPINSYLWILSDYFSNGLYKYKEKLYKLGSNGKINWKRTFKNKFYVKDNAPFYLDTVIEVNKSEENTITELQRYCINKSIDMLIFLGTFKKVRCNLDDKEVNKRKKYYIGLIEKEYRNTNNDKKQQLLLNIKNIINDNTSNNSSVRAFGTNNYAYVWEKMIRRLFGNVSDMREFFPFAYWYINGEKVKSSNMIEDTIYVDKNNKRIYIIDSKYYTYGDSKNTSGLPATSTIHKQVVYAEHVNNMDKYKEYEIYNIFVVPSNTNSFVEYEGFAMMDHIDERDNKSYEKIHLCLININSVIDKYLKYETNSIDKLFNVLIEKSII